MSAESDPSAARLFATAVNMVHPSELPMKHLLLTALLIFVLAGAAEAALPLRRGAGLHEWLNWSPLAADGSYRWPPYRTVDEWLAVDRPITDWPPGDPFQRIKSLGFDFVRLSVDPGPLLASEGTRRQQALDVLERDVRKVTAAGLKVVFNLQSVPQVEAYGPAIVNGGADSPGVAHYEKMVVAVAGMLEQIGSDKVAIDPFNEPAYYPCDTGGTDDWQRITEATVKAIRAVSRDLTIVVTGACGAEPDALTNLDPDFDDPDIYYTFHMYDPHSFTHQRIDGDLNAFASGLPWPANTGSREEVIAGLKARMSAAGLSAAAQQLDIAKVIGTVDGYFAENWGPAQLDRSFAEVAAWARSHRIPTDRVLVGEFGAILMSRDGRQGAFDADRLRYDKAVREQAEHYGMPWSIWEYSNPYGMTVIEPEGPAVPDEKLLEALGLPGA
jgi:endoglucanase